MGWHVEFIFSIHLHSRDLPLLKEIQAYFGGIGRITEGKNNCGYYVSSIEELTTVIIPHFIKYPLITQKLADFLLFKAVVDMANTKEHLTLKGLQKIVSLKASINLGLNDELKAAFPDTVPTLRPLVESVEIFAKAKSSVNYEIPLTTPGSSQSMKVGQWMAGFVSGGKASIRLENKRYYSTDIRQVETSFNLVLWGTNLSLTVRERFTSSELSIIKLPWHIQSIMVGIILSDAWLKLSKRSKNALLGFAQSNINSKYLWSVFFSLSHYCSSYPKIKVRNRLGTNTTESQFETRSMPCITELYLLFYPENIKVIPQDIYNLLTPIALAHLIMGDGSKQRHGLIICTDSYKLVDVVSLMNVLMIRYRLDCTIRVHNKNQPRIYINQSSMALLVKIVSPYMHYSMLYKLSSSLNKPRDRNEIEVFDVENNTATIYCSISEAAKKLNIPKSAIVNYYSRNQDKPYKGKYRFNKP